MSTSQESASSIPTVVIQPSRGWASLQLRAMWEYRELLYFLVWRDIVISIAITLLVLISGAVFFRRTERTFADII